MDVLLKQISKCNLLILKNTDAIDVAKCLPFYKIFKMEETRKKDIEEFENEIRNNLNIKFSLLEKLQQDIELQKADISSQLQELTLTKIASNENKI